MQVLESTHRRSRRLCGSETSADGVEKAPADEAAEDAAAAAVPLVDEIIRKPVAVAS